MSTIFYRYACYWMGVVSTMVVLCGSVAAMTWTSDSRLESCSADGNPEALVLALDRQLRGMRENVRSEEVWIGDGIVITPGRLLRSLERLQQLARQWVSCSHGTDGSSCASDFSAQVAKDFETLIPLSPEGNYLDSLLTAYYSPTIELRTVRDDIYQHPVYALPPENLRYFTRKEIEFGGKLENQSLELGYAKDLFDLYILHVEGGGHVVIRQPDGKTRRENILFAGTNGTPIQQMLDPLVNHGYISPDQQSRTERREYLRKHPEVWQQIADWNPGFVFFEVNKNRGPVGDEGVELTPGRSIATDKAVFPFNGGIFLITAALPEFSDSPTSLSRLFIAQDAGPAIKGANRADIYFGAGIRAEFYASKFRQNSAMRLLLLKEE